MLLGLALDPDEAHTRREQWSDDRGRIRPIVLYRLALTVGTHELGGHQPRLQPQRLHRTAPAMRTAAVMIGRMNGWVKSYCTI